MPAHAPILVMLASPTCPAGWHPVPGAAPAPGAHDAMALVLPSLYPLAFGMLLTADDAACLAACLPPEGFEPAKMEAAGPRDPLTLTERIGGFLFHVAALDFVRLAHPAVRWAPGGADGFGTITEVDLLHGWTAAWGCVAVVGRLAPTSVRA